MPEISDEQFEKLQKAEAEDLRRRESNRKRTVALARLKAAHLDEYARYFSEA